MFTHDAVPWVSASPVLCDGQRAISVPLYLLSVYGPGQIRYDGAKKRRLNHWIFCRLLLRPVRAHGSPHVSLSRK